MLSQRPVLTFIVLLAVLLFTAAQDLSKGNKELQTAVDAAIGEYITSGQFDTDWRKYLSTPPTIQGKCDAYPAYPTKPTAGGALARVIESGVMKVGVSNSLPTNSPNRNGTEDLMLEFIAKKLSTQYSKTITVSYLVPAAFNDLFVVLENGQVDFIGGGWGKSAERQAKYYFSCSYLTTGSALMRGPKRYNGAQLEPTAAQFNQTGVLIASVGGGIHQTFISNNLQKATVTYFTSFAQAFNASLYEEVHGTVFGITTSKYAADQSTNPTAFKLEVQNNAIPIGLVFRQDKVQPISTPSSASFTASHSSWCVMFLIALAALLF